MILENHFLVDHRERATYGAVCALKNQLKAQRSGFELERRGSGMSELSAKPEARDMELAPTRSS